MISPSIKVGTWRRLDLYRRTWTDLKLAMHNEATRRFGTTQFPEICEVYKAEQTHCIDNQNIFRQYLHAHILPSFLLSLP